MDDTSEVLGPPAPQTGEPPQQMSITPVTAAPSPQSGQTQTDTSAGSVPAFVKDLQADHMQQSATIPPPVAPGWREQMPVASVAIVLGAALVAWSLWQRRRVTQPRSVAGKAAVGKSARTRLTVQESILVQRDVADLTEKLAQQSEAMAHQLDVRAARLEALLAKSDERIAALEKQLAARPAVLMEAKPPVPPAPAHAPFDRFEPPGMQHRDVYALADSGLSPVQIAQRLGKPTGQVELILNLRRATV